ncbi:trichothecene 3-O-acetyltransferase [Ascobolus immersus RN42]|uniref:Trichothecene 3-O-acetyltransferase n=1 Tax=Ascobolus immersus RN42 TaxID=1160509 RepID=A0A3N4HM47_ASCIM|nr:trichothecene 3-O-acetyltransferase [Ascobolus immersus RN42]
MLLYRLLPSSTSLPLLLLQNRYFFSYSSNIIMNQKYQEPARPREWDLDIFAQQPFIDIYSPLVSIHPLHNDTQEYRAAIVERLQAGLDKMIEVIPWLAGEVIHEGVTATNTGVTKIRARPAVPIIEKYHDSPTYSELKSANFPSRMLTERQFCPITTDPSLYRAPFLHGFNPVFLIQANFIPGALLLTIMTNHTTCDMTGQGILMELLHKACTSTPFTPTEISSLNHPRTTAIPFLPSYDTSNIPYQLVPPCTSGRPGDGTNLPPVTWTFFTFTPAALSALKALASENLPSTTPFISTNDAVSALLYQRLSIARRPNLPENSTCTFSRAVNIRPFFADTMPPLYPANAKNMVYATYPLPAICDAPLSHIAADLRRLVAPETNTIRRDTQTLASLFHNSESKNVAGLLGKLNRDTDYVISCWSKLNCYKLDYGLGLGKPEVVRRPECEGGERLTCTYFMPMREDGELAVCAALRREELEGLRKDGVWGRFVREDY